MDFNFSLSRSTGPRIRNRGPLRLLVMGDFSGRAAAQRPALAGRPTHLVDFDNLDEVLRRLAPCAALDGDTLGFESLDDFHPDQLFARLPMFHALRALRQRLLDPAQFAQAAAELLRQPAPAASADPAQRAAAAPPRDDLLAQLLGGKPAGAGSVPGAPAAATAVDVLIRQFVMPHSVPDIAQKQATCLAAVDAALADAMRALLHAPAFQALESAWRGVQWLIASLELTPDLQLHLFDVTRDELLADVVAAQGQIDLTGLHQALVGRQQQPPGAAGWSALIGLYTFGPSDTDIGLLAALGVLAAQAGAPLLAGGGLSLASAEPGALATWQALRRSEVARWIGLAAPRVLLRLPYGHGGDPIERFKFDEFGATPLHDGYLWGNGALACALLIGRSFTTHGWDFGPDDAHEITGLPAYTVVRDGEPTLQPCAEQTLDDAAGQALLTAGLMPLLSHRQRNAVTVLRLQSVAEPGCALAGFGASA